MALRLFGYQLKQSMPGRNRRMKDTNFKQNGRLLLEHRIAFQQGASETTTTFTERELAEATNNFDATRLLGWGGWGKVYKGILPDQRVVAIKKYDNNNVVAVKKYDNNNEGPLIDVALNEIVIPSQIRHKNVVRIIGCCLETCVPMVVYEFVSNGSLYRHLYSSTSPLPWETRLRIAIEIANAMVYFHTPTTQMAFLHSFASMPIVHRDIKSCNILLDENYIPKLSGFGISILAPTDDQEDISAPVAGTPGYVDPEYFYTLGLTTKSDVYSFGVVLAELVTGKEPQTVTNDDRFVLAQILPQVMVEDCLFDIVDPRIRIEGKEEQIQNVANISSKCLRLKGEERPTMREVAIELGRLRRS